MKKITTDGATMLRKEYIAPVSKVRMMMGELSILAASGELDPESETPETTPDETEYSGSFTSKGIWKYFEW